MTNQNIWKRLQVMAMLLLCVALPQHALAGNAQLFNKVYDLVFGPQGSALSYKVNIIGLYKTEGTIVYKGKKVHYSEKRYSAWEDGVTAYMVDKKKQEVNIYRYDDDEKDKYLSKFKYDVNNFDFSYTAQGDYYLITAKVRNSVFTGNYFNANSQDHYGIVYLSGNALLENSVVYGNYAVAVTAGKASKSAGIYVSSGAPTVRNCVVCGNKKDGTLETGTEANWCFAAGLTPTVEYCNTPDLPDAGPTIQTAIPKFVDPDNTTVANRDFRLQADSPCVDAGLYQVWQKTAVDAAGAARFQGYKPDIGAYEFAKDTPALGIAADKARYYGAQNVTLTASSTNEAAMAPGTTYLWTVDGVEDMKRLWARNCDSVITNVPDIALKVRNEA